ncbi:MAG: TonB family protein [bacterium]|nr:MAG: TonB family protein [bacterium]
MYDGSRTTPKIRSRRKDWIVIIIIAVAAHIAFFALFKTDYLKVFEHDVIGDKGESFTPSWNDPFSLVPLPDDQETTTEVKKIIIIEEVETGEMFLDELGEPSTELMPIDRKSSGGSPGRKGQRRSTVEPKPLFIPWPKYPEGLDTQADGKVELLLYVNEKGEVIEVKLSRGLPQQILNRIAISAARKIRFSPGLEKGVPTSMWVRLTIGFQPR